MLCGCAKVPPPSADATPTPLSGIEIQYFDGSVRPQDDFYKHINGKWLADTEIPPDKGSYGTFAQLRDDAEAKLHTIIDGLQKSADTADPDQQKIADLYFSFMHEPTLESLGTKPLDAEFAKIDALKDKREIAGLIAHFNEIGVTAPYTPFVHQDAKDSTKYVFDVEQDGLGMPDRDYYLLNDDKLKQARERYGQHVQKMLELTGDKTAAAKAKDILALETQLAKIQWTKVELRDPIKTYNKVEFSELAGLAPSIDWSRYLTDTGVQGKTDYLIVGEPTYVRGLNELLRKTPLSTWKTYFRWHLLSDFAPYLSKPFVDEHFAFYGTALHGIPENRPRWKRGIQLVEDSIGEGLGQALRGAIFSAGIEGAHGSAGEKSAGRLQRRYRHARLDDAGDEGKGAGEAREVHAENRLSGQVARLRRPADRQRRSRRQRDPRADVRIQSQSQ